MIWKEININLKRYFMYVTIALILVMFTSKFNISNEKPVDMLNVAIVRDDRATQQMFEAVGDFVKTNPVDDIKQGYQIVQENKSVDAFVYYDSENRTVKILENQASKNAGYVKMLVQEVANPSKFTFKFVGEAVSKLGKLLDSFIYILSLVCFLIPFKMFSDEKRTLKALVFSPIKNYEIVAAKALGTIILFSFSLLFFYVSKDILIKEVILLFLVGLIYISIGVIMGIYYDNKIISAIFYPIMMLIILLPYIAKDSFARFLNILDKALVNYISFAAVSAALVSLFLILMLLANYLFTLKLRRERV